MGFILIQISYIIGETCFQLFLWEHPGRVDLNHLPVYHQPPIRIFFLITASFMPGGGYFLQGSFIHLYQYAYDTAKYILLLFKQITPFPPAAQSPRRPTRLVGSTCHKNNTKQQQEQKNNYRRLYFFLTQAKNDLRVLLEPSRHRLRG